MGTIKTSHDALALFSTTADQRYLLGREIFLRTHYPIVMKTTNKNKMHTMLNENELFEQLLQKSLDAPGNQLWAVYGSPGSGKSELMRWLETQIKEKNPKRAAGMIRITRNELDIFSIVTRFAKLLPTEFFTDLLQQRWALAQQKPRTLSKLILLHALENSFESDETINGLFYRLVNIMHPHVERLITSTRKDTTSQVMDILSIEAWNAILQETAIPVTLDYEQFRHRLIVAFNQQLLNGFSFAETLNKISNAVLNDLGTRPILLIDDFIQSMNLFATDMLDYFLDLEKGNWDVIIGLTPAAFEDSQRGRHLLERLTYLDTIDDRIEKLWLSDEGGIASFFLTEENCSDFAKLYLTEFFKNSGSAPQAEYLPFNKEVLTRIFRGLPQGKGKARYFLRHLRLIMEANQQGEPFLPTVEQFAKTEFVAHHQERMVASFCELYGPLLSNSAQSEITLTQDQLHLIGIKKKILSVPIEPIIQEFSSHDKQLPLLIEDNEKVAIRDWILGKETNRQLFHTVRQGIARLVRAASVISTIHTPYIAAPSKLLQWHHTYLDVHPPICFEGVDQEDGIFIPRTLQYLIFDVYHYAHASGSRAKELEIKLLNNANIQNIIMQAEAFHYARVDQLEIQIGFDLAYSALSLCLWSLLLQPEPSLFNLLPQQMKNTISQQAQPYFLYEKEKLLRQYSKDWLYFFNDFFQLREHFYDVPHLTDLCTNHTLNDILSVILDIDATKIGSDYRWGKKELSLAVAEWQEFIKHITSSDPHNNLSSSLQVWLQQLEQAGKDGIALNHLPEEILLAFIHSRNEVISRFRIHLIPENQPSHCE